MKCLFLTRKVRRSNKKMEVNIFFDRVKQLSKAQNKSINQVEKELGYPRNSLNGYKGDRSPSAQRLLEISDYFGVSPYYLMGYAEFNNRNFVELYLRFLTSKQREELFHLCKQYQEDKNSKVNGLKENTAPNETGDI
jgi:transcriptional regulator with XRE-family HTH domain